MANRTKKLEEIQEKEIKRDKEKKTKEDENFASDKQRRWWFWWISHGWIIRIKNWTRKLYKNKKFFENSKSAKKIYSGVCKRLEKNTLKLDPGLTDEEKGEIMFKGFDYVPKDMINLLGKTITEKMFGTTSCREIEKKLGFPTLATLATLYVIGSTLVKKETKFGPVYIKYDKDKVPTIIKLKSKNKTKKLKLNNGVSIIPFKETTVIFYNPGVVKVTTENVINTRKGHEVVLKIFSDIPFDPKEYGVGLGMKYKSKKWENTTWNINLDSKPAKDILFIGVTGERKFRKNLKISFRIAGKTEKGKLSGEGFVFISIRW